MTTEQRETRNHFDHRFDELNDQHNKMMQEIASIKRGVYGDEVNEVPGLIDFQKDHNKRIKSLEETRKKALWSFGGIVAALEGLWHFFVHK